MELRLDPEIPVTRVVNGIAITPEGKWYRFDSITQAAQKLNLNYATVRRYIKRKIKPQNGWQWFLEKDNNWIKHIDNGKIK